MPLDLGYQTLGQKATQEDPEFQKRKMDAMKALQQSAESDRYSRIREGSRAGLQTGAGTVAGSSMPSSVSQQRNLGREMEIAKQDTDQQRAQALGQAAIATREGALAESQQRGAVGLAEQNVGFQEQIAGRQEATSQGRISLMQDEVSRIREDLNNKGSDIDNKYRIQLAVLDSAKDQFNKQMSDAQYQFENGRLSQQELIKIEQDAQAKLAQLERQYASTISDIQRASAIEAAATAGASKTATDIAQQKAAGKANMMSSILPGVSGIMGVLGGGGK